MAEVDKQKIAFQLIPRLMNPTLVNFLGHYAIDKIEGTESKRSDDEKYLISVYLMFGITLPFADDTFQNADDHFLFMQMLLDNYNVMLKDDLAKKCFPETKLKLETQIPKSNNDPNFPNENIKICQRFLDVSGFFSKWHKTVAFENVDRGMHISFCTGMHYGYSYGTNPTGKDGKILASGKEISPEMGMLRRSMLNDGDQADKALHKLISNEKLKLKI